VLRASQFEEPFAATAVVWSRVLFATSLPLCPEIAPLDGPARGSRLGKSALYVQLIIAEQLLGDFSNENISIAGVGEGWPVGILRLVLCRLSALLIYI
jgi:hypothetical protein